MARGKYLSSEEARKQGRELKRSPVPSVSVENAGQVNIGQQQMNKVES